MATRSPNHPDVLNKRREQLEHPRYGSGPLLAALERDGAKITHISRVSDVTWFIRTLFPQHLQERYGTAPEVLVIYVAGAVQARDLRAARGEAFRSGLRLDVDLVIVADRKPGLVERLSRLQGRGQRVAWQRDNDGFPALQAVLAEQLPTFDIFEERDPVRGTQVLGRRDEIASLSTRVERGDAVGVFGLRKVGKTTLVRAVTDTLDPLSTSLSARVKPDKPAGDAQVIAAWLDVQRVFRRTLDVLADSLAESLEARLRLAGLPDGDRDRDPVARLDQLIRWGMEETDATLCLVMDEYDLLFEGAGDRSPIPDLATLFGLLRGWAQETGRLSLVLIGRDPEFASSPRMDGISNPMLGWFTPHWLGPLDQKRATEMLRKLGRRAGLYIGHQTAALAWEWTGGHPLLHRQFGSATLELARLHGGFSERLLPTDPFCEQSPELFRRRRFVRDTTTEILDLLNLRYPDALSLLIALSDAEEPARMLADAEGSDTAGLQVLSDFGLVRYAENTVLFPRYLSWYVPRSTRGARQLAGA